MSPGGVIVAKSMRFIARWRAQRLRSLRHNSSDAQIDCVLLVLDAPVLIRSEVATNAVFPTVEQASDQLSALQTSAEEQNLAMPPPPYQPRSEVTVAAAVLVWSSLS